MGGRLGNGIREPRIVWMQEVHVLGGLLQPPPRRRSGGSTSPSSWSSTPGAIRLSSVHPRASAVCRARVRGKMMAHIHTHAALSLARHTASLAQDSQRPLTISGRYLWFAGSGLSARCLDDRGDCVRVRERHRARTIWLVMWRYTEKQIHTGRNSEAKRRRYGRAACDPGPTLPLRRLPTTSATRRLRSHAPTTLTRYPTRSRRR